MIPTIFCRTFATILAAILLLAVRVQSAELVINGGFEQSATGNNNPAVFPPGWTDTDPSGFSGVDNTPGFQHSGAKYANLGGNSAPPNNPPSVMGTLSQTLATVAGQAYTLSFWLANDGDGSGVESFQMMFGAITMTVTLAPNGGTFGPYTQFTFAGLVAPTNSTALQFKYQNDSYYRLDDVSVQGPGQVPDSGTTLLLALPALGALCVVYSRKARFQRI